jgi:hypothetical protein
MTAKCARRALLKTVAGGVLLAPFLRMRQLEAQYAAPKRLILVFTPDSHPREWWPLSAAGQPGFTLQGPLLDFAGLESQLLFVRQLDHSWSFDNHHEAGVAQLFTGQYFFDEATHYANGPSIDQVLLKNTPLRGGTPIADIHLCAADKGGGQRRHVCCYSGPGQPIVREWNPQRAYRRIFAGASFTGAQPPAAPSPDRARTLAIHAVELQRIQGFLGGAERERLQLHVEALHDLELQLQAASRPAAVSSECRPFDIEAIAASDHDEHTIASWAKLQADMIVSAFACDRTRVAEYAFGYSGSNHVGMLGLTSGTRGWHEIAHMSLDNGLRALPVEVAGEQITANAAYIRFDRSWASQVAYLTRRLAAIPEGDGTMLDNTLIYWGAESGTDHNHSPLDMQYALIGGRNLGIAGGQFLQFPSVQSAHKLHTSVLHAFGHAANGFGVEPACGPLPGVLR